MKNSNNDSRYECVLIEMLYYCTSLTDSFREKNFYDFPEVIHPYSYILLVLFALILFSKVTLFQTETCYSFISARFRAKNLDIYLRIKDVYD